MSVASVEAGASSTMLAGAGTRRRGRPLLLASALLVALALVFAAPSRSLADPSSEPVLQTGGAQSAWGYLESEAEALLSAEGLTASMSRTQARGLIRSYIFLRLIGAIDEHNPSTKDQAALSYLRTLVTQEQYYTAVNAGQTWNDWVTKEFGCPNGNLTDYLVWEGGNASCGFWQLFGSHPEESAFTTAGYQNLWSTFSSDGTAARALNDMVAGTSYWGGVATHLPSGLVGEAETAGDAIHGVIEGEFGPEVQELLINLGTTLVDSVGEEGPGPDDLIPLGLAAGVIAANSIWNVFDVKNIAEGLQEAENATNPANNPPAPDLSRLTQSPGITELAYLVASQTLAGATTEALPCTVNGASETNRCNTYTFGADANFEDATYESQPTPLPDQSTPEADTEPFFEVTELEGANQGVTCDSVTVEPPANCGGVSSIGAGIMSPWQTSLPNGPEHSVTVDAEASAGRNAPSQFRGYRSFIHNGMFVTRAVAAGEAVEDTWTYRPGISYEAPDGTRWEAYYQNGSFLQTKLAAPIAGAVYTGYQAEDVGGTQCEEKPTWAAKLFEATPTGNLCLFETTSTAHAGQVKLPLPAGSEVLVLGARAEVKETTNCWEDTLEDHRCAGNGLGNVLYPGQDSQIGATFEWQNLVNDITGLDAFEDPFSFSPQDSKAWLVTHLNTCAGRPGAGCESQSSDMANCSLPATEDPSEPWTTTTCFRGSEITYTDAIAGGNIWRAKLITPPAVLAHKYTADADQASSSCCATTRLSVPVGEGLLAGASGTGVSTSPTSNISLKIVQQPAHGTLTFNKKDGSFSYLPNSGFGWSAPATDTFTYAVCNSTLPTWEKHCGEATATITVRQAPPTAGPVTILSNIGAPAPGSYLYVSSYKYSDRQEVPEGTTTFAWYRNGQPIGFTGSELPIGAADVGSVITAVVTPTAQDGTQGEPATSAGLTIIGGGPYSYVAQPTSDELSCAPTPLYYPATPPMTTECTATVKVRSQTADFSGAAKPAGKVSFRSSTPGAFASPSCSLAYKSFVEASGTGTTTSSCSVTFTPSTAGTAGVVGAFSYSIAAGGVRGAPGGFGKIADYKTTSVPVGEAGPGGAVRFLLSGLSNAAAATPQSVTVTAIDGYGNPAPGYTGTIHFSSSDANAGLPADYTFTAGDNGTHTFTGVVLNTAKSSTVTASDTTLPAIKGSQSALISVGPAAKFVLSGFKFTTLGGITAGASQKLTTTVEDAGGNIVTGYTGTVHFSSSDSKATLPADYTFTSADHGVHTLAGGELALKTVSIATIGVSDGTVSSSTKVTVDAAATSHLQIELEDPSKPVLAGEPRTLFVTALDAYGNVTPFYTGAVAFSSSDAGATLPALYTFTDSGPNGDFGQHFFHGVILRAVGKGQQTISLADVTHGATKGSISLSVLAAPTTALRVSVPVAPGGDVAGKSQTVTVSAIDAFGNVTPGYEGTVVVTSSDPGAALPQPYTFTSADAGVHQFSGFAPVAAGTQTVTAMDLETNSIEGSQAVPVVGAAPAQLKLSGLTDGPPGGAQTVTVLARDAYGNVAGGYTGTVAFSSSDPAAVLPANYTFTPADHGEHTFSGGVTLNTLGSQTVTVTDTASKSRFASETVGVAQTKFAISAGSMTEGQAGAVTVRDSAASDAITESGKLPAGVSFAASGISGGSSAGEGEAVFSGTPQAGSAGTYPVTLSVHSASPPVEYEETFTLTVHAPTPGVSLQATSSSLDARSVVVQIGFTGTDTVPEGGSIAVTAPPGVTFGGEPGFGGVLSDTVYAYDNGHFATQESPTVSTTSGVSTLTVPVHEFSINHGDHVTLDIAAVNNPSAASSGSWTVANSTNPTPVSVGQQSFPEENGVAPLNASVSPSTAKATHVWYEETFVVADELRVTDFQGFSLFMVPGDEGEPTITVTAPTGASFPGGCPAGYLTDASHVNDSQPLSCIGVNGNQVTYQVEHANVPAGDDATVFVENAGTNPSKPGSYQISVATSGDPEGLAVPVLITH